MAANSKHASTTLLVVDDDDDILGLVCRLLEEDGHRVIPARDGFEALTLARKRGDEIHVLLTDIRMPGIDGRELADRVVRLKPHIRVIYMTGFSEQQLERGELMLRKPFRPAELRAAVSRSFARPNGRGRSATVA